MQIEAVKKIDPIVKFGVVLLALKTSFSYSNIIFYPEFVDSAMTALATVVLFFAMIRHKYSKKNLILFLLIGLIVLYSTICSGNYGLLITVITCMAAYREDFNSVIKCIFTTELIFFLIHTGFAVVLNLLGFISIRMVSTSRGFRYNFGFGHPNTFSIYFLNLVVMWTWLYYFSKNNKRKYLLCMLALTIAVYFFTDTRTMLFGAIVFYGLLLTVSDGHIKHKWLTICAGIINPICCFAMIATSVMYASQLKSSNKNLLIVALDYLLSSRIRLGAYGFANYGLTLFGQDLSGRTVVWDQYWKLNGHTFDDVYTYCAMNIGIVWLILIIVLFYKLAKKSYDKVNIFIILWALYGVSEVHVLNGYMFFPIFMVMMVFSSSSNCQENRHIRSQLDG